MSGESIEDAVKALQPYFSNELFWAFGVNCTPLDAISGLLDRINATFSTFAEVTGPPDVMVSQRKPRLLAYPNSGEVFSFETYTWTGDKKTDEFLDLAEKWVNEQGVSVVGGCCRFNDSDIETLRKRLNPKKATALALEKQGSTAVSELAV